MRSSRAPVYCYVMDWRTPERGGSLRSPHGGELPMVFDTVAAFPGLEPRRAEAQALADIMSHRWASFARTGTPNAVGLPDWPAYTAARRATMRFDTPCAVVDDPLGAEQALIAAYA